MKDKRTWWMLLCALVLILGVLGVSRLADFGILPGEDFGATHVERNHVQVELSVRSEGGQLSQVGRALELAPGDRLELTYGTTRYPYLWILAIDQSGRAQPLVADRHTAANGETLVLDPPTDRFVLLALFSAVPRTLDQIQASLDREVRLPGLRFAWIIGPAQS